MVSTPCPTPNSRPCPQQVRPARPEGRKLPVGKPAKSGAPSRGLTAVPSTSEVKPSERSSTVAVRARTRRPHPGSARSGHPRPAGSLLKARSSRSNLRASIVTQALRDEQFGSYFIGIELEFVLQPADRPDPPPNFKDFLTIMIRRFNEETEKSLPRMRLETLEDRYGISQDFESWTVIVDETITDCERFEKRYETWGVELTSPIFPVFRGGFVRGSRSDWRNQVFKTWDFIHKYYLVTANLECSTHIHISKLSESNRKEDGLRNLKRIAQCAIHFEPALEALVSPLRRGNPYVASNWIDNPRFREESLTRENCIALIGRCANETSLIDLMSCQEIGRYWAWNFRAIEKFGSIEFRKGDASRNGREAVAWAELVLLFVQAAVQTTPESLKEVPANVAALKNFLGRDKLLPLKPLLAGKSGRESLQPTLLPYERIGDPVVLQRKLKFDEEKQRRLARRQNLS